MGVPFQGIEADFECTWWLDGWPTWIGGNGHEWLNCCIQHDLTPKSLHGDWALASCVWKISPVMAVLMFLGLGTFGTIYVALKKRKKGSEKVWATGQIDKIGG